MKKYAIIALILVERGETMSIKMKTGSKNQLFLELAQPDEKGMSRWVSVEEFIGKYADLSLGNGGSWCRKESTLARTYDIEFDKSKTKGNSIDCVRLAGWKTNEEVLGRQTIRSDIKQYYKEKRCVILGTSNPEVDHKNGRKNDPRVMKTKTQTFEDFQPLSKAANDAKRQFCKECKASGCRYDAKLLGYPISYYKGTQLHDKTKDGCIGCFWYDPVAFRNHLNG